MKNYLLVIDGYGNFETDSFEDAMKKYSYLVHNNIPVAMYKRIKIHK